MPLPDTLIPVPHPSASIPPSDGYELWLNYRRIKSPERQTEYSRVLSRVDFATSTPILKSAHDELARASRALLGRELATGLGRAGRLVVGTSDTIANLAELIGGETLDELGSEGFRIEYRLENGQPLVMILGHTDRGVLYGVFRFLQHLQLEQPLANLSVRSVPRIARRILNHWDNLDRTVERGYAGFSLWEWHKLPGYMSPRYTDYARANASVGINGAVLTNVEAPSLLLTTSYLQRVAKIADALRPWGLRVYLTARFSAPLEVGGLDTADPLEPLVIAWWQAKTAEIYQIIPDFGGFLVKTNTEGNPGTAEYGRSHCDKTNLLARALQPHGGIVMGQAFVYHPDCPDDCAKQAYDEFVPLDGSFEQNACLQVKNGPIDFQPREPFHPLFGAMPRTPLFLEVQLTQEYLGQGTHLVYLGPLFQEALSSSTFRPATGSTVADVVQGCEAGHGLSGMAGVANIGTDRNWCGHPFSAANWFAFGRLAWNPHQNAGELAKDWLGLTFTTEPAFIELASEMMLGSREAAVDYMTPLGLHHIMAQEHHYGPGPWVTGGRGDRTSVYYHRADAGGIGFDRTCTGSNAVMQYAEPYRQRVQQPESCPENLLLWFHHLAWNYPMPSGRCLWDELCLRYQRGVDYVQWMTSSWTKLRPHVDEQRHHEVSQLLGIQLQEALWWMDACLLYFGQFSGLPRPAFCMAAQRELKEYQERDDYYVPGIPERRVR
jgi:alpha-glucuronidase